MGMAIGPADMLEECELTVSRAQAAPVKLYGFPPLKHLGRLESCALLVLHSVS